MPSNSDLSSDTESDRGRPVAGNLKENWNDTSVVSVNKKKRNFAKAFPDDRNDDVGLLPSSEAPLSSSYRPTT